MARAGTSAESARRAHVSEILCVLNRQMFLLVLSEASWLQFGAADLCVPWVEERVLPGLERPAGPSQLPGAGLQQVRRSSLGHSHHSGIDMEHDRPSHASAGAPILARASSRRPLEADS